jgi:predicted acylesterase/phospholipase RssA
MRVAYQAGVLQALVEAGLTFDHADGTSGGTINLAMLMSGLTTQEMCERWRTLHVPDFVSLMPLGEYLKGPLVPAMGSAEGITRRVFPHLGIDVSRINRARGMSGTFNVCNFSTKSNEVVTHDRVTLPHLVAGISLPIFMPAVPIDGALYTDSVWIQDANVMEAVRRGAEEVWLVWCIGNTPEYHDGPFQQYVHMIEMSANGKLFAELGQVAAVNARIERGESEHGQRRPIRLHVVKPEYPLPLDPDYYLGRIDSTSLVAMGYGDARAYCAKLGGEDSPGAPLSPEATRMRVAGPGVSFRETIAGRFDGDRGGAPGGADDAAELRIRAAVCVQDVARFVRGETHAGRVSATLDVPGIGKDILCYEGAFVVVSGAEGPATIRYEVPFAHGGRAYFLEASRTARHPAEVRVRLQEGGRSGPVIRSGTLTASARDVAATVKSLHAIHCPSPLQLVETEAAFGRFVFCDAYDRARRPWWRFW